MLICFFPAIAITSCTADANNHYCRVETVTVSVEEAPMDTQATIAKIAATINDIKRLSPRHTRKEKQLWKCISLHHTRIASSAPNKIRKGWNRLRAQIPTLVQANEPPILPIAILVIAIVFI